MRIVLIEDNQMLAEGIQKILLDEGHSVDYFVDGKRADQHLRYEGADLAIIDINLPNMDGISITKNIRARKQLFPIIILTARGATKDRVIGLDAGADDYLVKPFQMDELDARIRALSRRNTSLLSNTLFEILINKKGQYISKSSLADTQYGIGSDININAIEISISRLRKILSTYNIQITTARGIGYMMDDKLE
jgi:two-component system OmpR family response regulator